jgi:branched-chain amino acid transport system substrate-binding protein
VTAMFPSKARLFHPGALIVLLLGGCLWAPDIAWGVQPYQIPVIIELTGGAAFSGNGVKANLEALEERVNRTGGIDGHPLEFVFEDDETMPQTAVMLANMALAKHPAVILTSVLVAMCNAEASIAQKRTVLYCLSPAFHPAAGSAAFSANTATDYQVEALLRYYRAKGWTTLAVLNGTDATGQNADKAIEQALAAPENRDIRMVEHSRFNLSDISVSAQMERIKQSGAQALIAWTTGASVTTIFKGMIQTGLEIPVGTSSGNQTFSLMEQDASFLPRQLIIPSAIFPEHDGILELDPRVEKAQHDMYSALAAHHLKSDISTSDAWDAGMIVVDALRKLGPHADAAQIGRYIAGLTDFAGVNGLYNFKAYPGRGLGPDSATLVRFDAKGKLWVWLSKPGGEPLD